ncbi:MAG: helix-turn-helix transcriptional regulator [Clostridia bacterium]|nr:helix-turn-helix transcriptional regulator [Clostridia bacterium]
MLNPQIISENIIHLRQKMGLTQQELAAKANVTHQAVSKWENGSSIPDLQTLMTLSRLFGVSLDELLTEVLADRKAPEAAPAAPQPEAADKQAEAVEAPAEESEEETAEAADAHPAFDLRDLVGLAPFLPKDRLSALVLEQIDSVTPEKLVPLAPFLGRQALDEISAKMDFSAVTPNRLIALAPFLSRATLEEALGRMNPESLTPGQLTALAPFIGQNALGRFVRSIGQLPMKMLTMLAPFLSRETLSQQVEGLANGHAPAGREEAVDAAGELTKSRLRKAMWKGSLAVKLAEEGEFDELEELLPGLDQDTLTKVVDMAIDADETDFLVENLDRLPGDAQRKIALRLAENGDFDEIGDFFNRLNSTTRAQIVDMALDADETDFLEDVFNTLNGEQQKKIALRYAENGDFDEIEDIFARLNEETREKIIEMAINADEIDFLKSVHALGMTSRKNQGESEANEAAAADKALMQARRGDFSAVPGLMDRLTDEQKDEVVRLAIVFDNTDFLTDCVEDLPPTSLETLCFSLARMGEVKRLAAFQGYLAPEVRLRVEKIVAEKG